MILDTLSNATKYTHLKSGLSEAFGFLNQPQLDSLPDGKYGISGEQVFAIISRQNGREISEGQLEGHRKYLDIQYLISGAESIGWSPREGLINTVAYDEEKDLEFFAGTPQSLLVVAPCTFALFLPSDAHLPLIGKGAIHKVVVKVAVGS